jgi:hypothetical protein
MHFLLVSHPAGQPTELEDLSRRVGAVDDPTNAEAVDDLLQHRADRHARKPGIAIAKLPKISN